MRIHSQVGVMRVGLRCRRLAMGALAALLGAIGVGGFGGIGHAACGSWLGDGSKGGSKDAVAIYVDDDAPLGGDGTSWNQALPSLQSALEIAASGKTGDVFVIKVAQGTYVPTKRSDPLEPRSVTFQLANGVSLLGGYAGPGAPDPDQRDPLMYETVLSGVLPNGTHALHVLIGSDTDQSAVLSGFTATGGSADIGDYQTTWPITTHLGGGLFSYQGGPLIEDCRFTGNFARHGAGIYSRDAPPTLVVNCVFSENTALTTGSGIRCSGEESMTISRCTFVGNDSPYGSCLACTDGDCRACTTTVIVENCDFIANTSSSAPAHFYHTSNSIVSSCNFVENVTEANAGALASLGPISVQGCLFLRNSTTGYGAGAATIDGGSVLNCAFIGNDGWIGGGMIAQSCTITNCLFSRNTAETGGAIFFGAGNLTVANCTIVGNSSAGIRRSNTETNGNLLVQNSILWGNIPAQIDTFDGNQPPPPGFVLPGSITVQFSDIQGGWAGFGNISSDPMLIQPGCDNARLAYRSPCINAGSIALIPPGLALDLDGLARIQDGGLDIGCYEGGHEMLPLMACADDLDEGEQVKLTPAGGAYLPIQNAAINLTNTSGPNNVTVSVTQAPGNLHAGAAGFNSLCVSLSLYTTLLDGEGYDRVTIPFDQSNLNGFAIEDMNLTYFDSKAGQWRLAAMGDTQNSPGHDGPLGDRTVVFGTGAPGYTFDLGDYGLFWNTSLQRGFVWANVDYATDFAAGIALPACPGDTSYPVDNVVDVEDLQKVFATWGITPAGPASFADIDRNGFVDIDDLLEVIRHWGPCQ